MKNNYTIYIPSRGRHDCCFTAQNLSNEGIDFKIVTEESEANLYAKQFSDEKILTLPDKELQEFKEKSKITGFDIAFRRTWIKKYSESLGEDKHWQIDDNVTEIRKVTKGKSKTTDFLAAIDCVETFTGKFTNIGIAGLRHAFLAFAQNKPFQLNQQVYSCVLVTNAINCYWRPDIIEDTDFSLQVLSRGYCTVLINAFVFNKPVQGTLKGGNSDTQYSNNQNKKITANELKRKWPLIVKLGKIKDSGKPKVSIRWSKFTTKLIEK